MYFIIIGYIILIFAKVPHSPVSCVQIDIIDCGVDHEVEVFRGDIEIQTYPWLGILYYYFNGDMGETRAVTPVALIHAEFVVGAAADIGEMPKHNFRASTRVLLGESWEAPGRRVRNYVMHPEYGTTYNTIAIVQLRDRVRYGFIKPLCPAPEILRNPEFFVVRFREDYENLRKQVISMSHVPGNMCKDFYVAANLYSKMMRPPHVVCAVSLETDDICVWEAGAVLVARDVWGRWQLLGFGVRGPGCGAPSRYLDMLSYYPWLHSSLNKFRRLTISKITNQKYVLRTSTAYQKFGACDPEEKVNLIYREAIVLRTDNTQYQFLTYNMSLYESVEMTCLTLELVNASAVSEMKIKHRCAREAYGPACYEYKQSVFEISVFLMFSDKCTFEMFAWGERKVMDLIDIMEWKWEEGTYYEMMIPYGTVLPSRGRHFAKPSFQDFTLKRHEYHGQSFMTLFGYEPLDTRIWVPEYDIWTTTEFDNSTWSSTTPPPDLDNKGTAPPYDEEGGTTVLPPFLKGPKDRVNSRYKNAR